MSCAMKRLSASTLRRRAAHRRAEEINGSEATAQAASLVSFVSSLAFFAWGRRSTLIWQSAGRPYCLRYP